MKPTVSSLWIYPIKSCRGIALKIAEIDRRGLRYDRTFMLVDAEQRMITQRSDARLCRIGVSIGDEMEMTLVIDGAPQDGRVSLDGETDGAATRVRVHDDEVDAFDQGDEVAATLIAFLGAPTRLARIADDAHRRSPDDVNDVSFADAFSFLGIGDATLAELNSRLKSPIEMRRFRPNITFAGAPPFAEDSWKRVRAADLTLLGHRLCKRCVIPATNPDTGARELEPSATLATYRRGAQLAPTPTAKIPSPEKIYFGRNFSHLGVGGAVAVGDEVVVEEVD